MDRHIIFDRARRYLAAELGCDVSELSGSGTVYVANERARAPFIKLAAIGERVIASASPELLPKVRELTEGRSRDEIFELPLVYGQTIHFVPDSVPDIPLPGGYEYRLLEGDGVYELSGLEGFPNSLAFDGAGHTGTGIVFFAKSGDGIIALAGAGEEYEGLWEMGVDTDPAYRGRGLGAALVARLAGELMARGRAAFYSASVTNTGSQSVAHRAGLRPLWVDTYSNTLLEDYIYKDISIN